MVSERYAGTEGRERTATDAATRQRLLREAAHQLLGSATMRHRCGRLRTASESGRRRCTATSRTASCSSTGKSSASVSSTLTERIAHRYGQNTGLSPEDVIVQMCAAFWDFCDEYPDYATLLLRETFDADNSTLVGGRPRSRRRCDLYRLRGGGSVKGRADDVRRGSVLTLGGELHAQLPRRAGIEEQHPTKPVESRACTRTVHRDGEGARWRRDGRVLRTRWFSSASVATCSRTSGPSQRRSFDLALRSDVISSSRAPSTRDDRPIRVASSHRAVICFLERPGIRLWYWVRIARPGKTTGAFFRGRRSVRLPRPLGGFARGPGLSGSRVA